MGEVAWGCGMDVYAGALGVQYLSSTPAPCPTPTPLPRLEETHEKTLLPTLPSSMGKTATVGCPPHARHSAQPLTFIIALRGAEMGSPFFCTWWIS